MAAKFRLSLRKRQNSFGYGVVILVIALFVSGLSTACNLPLDEPTPGINNNGQPETPLDSHDSSHDTFHDQSTPLIAPQETSKLESKPIASDPIPAETPKAPELPPRALPKIKIKKDPSSEITRIDSTNKRVFAIGDLHGDLNATIRILEGIGAINSDGHWIGRNLIVVQLGDLIDRGTEDYEVLSLIERLENEAPDWGSQLVILNGNHEFMNLGSDFREVNLRSLAPFIREKGKIESFLQNTLRWHPSEIAVETEKVRRLTVEEMQRSLDFLEYKPVQEITASPGFLVRSFFELNYPGQNLSGWIPFDLVDRLIKILENRAMTFGRGFQLAHQFAKRLPFVVVGDSVFVHGGLLPEHLDYGLNKIETEARSWMLDGSYPHPGYLNAKGGLAAHAPWWTRELSSPEADSTQCLKLAKVLNALRVSRMVVGHTITASGKIELLCDGELVKIDVALSSAFWHRQNYIRPLPYQILEIIDHKSGQTALHAHDISVEKETTPP